MNNWFFNELNHCGVDYSNKKQAEDYDNQHQKFRDYEKEFADMINFLSLSNTKELSLLDLGCGTGAIAIYASKLFKKIYAVDISEAMINQAKRKAVNEEIDNIEFVNAGFLSYEHSSEKVDIIMTKAALHHLPDFWKQIALLKMNKMLKMGGILYISDVIYHFEPIEYTERINTWISHFESIAGSKFKAEIETHIRDEYSTFNWIIEDMLKRAGFSFKKSRTNDGFLTEHYCIKTEEKF